METKDLKTEKTNEQPKNAVNNLYDNTLLNLLYGDFDDEIVESREAKVKRLFKAPSQSRIKTFAILTAENPDGQEASKEENAKNTDNLKKQLSYIKPENLERSIDTGGFSYYKVKGRYNDNIEHSFLVFNISLDDAKKLSSFYRQQSFIYGKNENGKLVFEILANKSLKGYSYRVCDRRDLWYQEEDGEDVEKEYTQISRDFKIRIPFDQFAWSAEDLEEHLVALANKHYDVDRLLEESLSDKICARVKYYHRFTLYKMKI